MNYKGVENMQIKMYVKKDYLTKLIENTVFALNWWDLDTIERPTRAELEKMVLAEFLQNKNIELIVND